VAQSSTIKFGTRLKSRTFRVTTMAPCSKAIAAMRKSIFRTLSFKAARSSKRIVFFFSV